MNRGAESTPISKNSMAEIMVLSPFGNVDSFCVLGVVRFVVLSYRSRLPDLQFFRLIRSEMRTFAIPVQKSSSQLAARNFGIRGYRRLNPHWQSPILLVFGPASFRRGLHFLDEFGRQFNYMPSSDQESEATLFLFALQALGAMSLD
jgi:hypothetical protein